MNVEIYLKEIGDVHDHIAGHANEHSGDREDAFFGSDQTGGAAIIAARLLKFIPSRSSPSVLSQTC